MGNETIRPFELLNYPAEYKDLEDKWKVALDVMLKTWFENPNDRQHIYRQLLLYSNFLFLNKRQSTPKGLRRKINQQVETVISEITMLDPLALRQELVSTASLIRMRLKARQYLNRFRDKTEEGADNFKIAFYRALQLAVYAENLTYGETDRLLAILKDSDAYWVGDPEVLGRWLLKIEFNAPEILRQLINQLQMKLQNLPGLYEQLEFLTAEQSVIQDDNFFGEAPYYQRQPSLKSNLHAFLQGKILYVEQRIRQRREELNDELLKRTDTRLRINLPVAQFGLLIRLFLEKGLLLKDHIGETFSFFSRNFFSPQTQYISADSLQKKSTDVEFATAQKLKAILISMINWLNEHYKLADF